MNCESCSGTMTQVYGQSHHHCQPCNVFSFPTPIDQSIEAITPTGNETEFSCPQCAINLEVGTIHGIMQVCFCKNCRGYVVDNSTFGVLANEMRGAYQGPDDQPQPIDPKQLDIPTNCPACMEKMDAHPYYGPGSIVLDTCMHCKLAWLDHGELGRIIRAPGLRNANKSGNLESSVLRTKFDAQCKEDMNAAIQSYHFRGLTSSSSRRRRKSREYWRNQFGFGEDGS